MQGDFYRKIEWKISKPFYLDNTVFYARQIIRCCLKNHYILKIEYTYNRMNSFDAAKGTPYNIVQLVEKPLGARGPQPPEAIIGFGGVYGKSAKSLA